MLNHPSVILSLLSFVVAINGLATPFSASSLGARSMKYSETSPNTLQPLISKRSQQKILLPRRRYPTPAEIQAEIQAVQAAIEAGKTPQPSMSCQLGPCSSVTNGYSTCNTLGGCTPQCTNPALNPFKNGNQLVCFDLKNDANNCGSIGNVCSAGYNGLGMAKCAVGNCSLDCSTAPGTRVKYMPSGAMYCGYN